MESRDGIVIIVPWKAGGDTTLMTQQLCAPLSKALGVAVTIQNIEGGDGTTGALAARAAPPDGKTLFAVHESIHGSWHAGVADVAYTDFEPLCLLTTAPSVIGTYAAAPWRTLGELVEDARRRPGEITFGGSMGSSSFMLPSLIQHKAGVQLKYVPVDGTADRLARLKAGQIDLAEMNVPGSKGTHADVDKMRVLALASPSRHPGIPDIATLREQGFDITYALYRGLLAPRGTPADVLDRLDAAVGRAVADADYVRQTEKLQAKVTYKPRGEYAAFLRETDDAVVEDLRVIGALQR